jgi:homeobox-leucine zipper protein
LKQTEMECEYLKRWFGTLTEHNRRLQKEVEELRAMKVGPPTVLLSPHSCEPLPASTLSMCPRCERVTTNTADKFLTDAVILSPKVSTPALHSRQIWYAIQSFFLTTRRALYINWLCKTEQTKSEEF